MEGVVSAAWNQFVQANALQVDSRELGAEPDDNVWKHVGFGLGVGKTKLEAKEAAQVYIFQRYYHDTWDRMVKKINSVHYTKKGSQLLLEEVSIAEVLEWNKIRDLFLGENFVNQDIPRALELAAIGTPKKLPNTCAPITSRSIWDSFTPFTLA